MSLSRVRTPGLPAVARGESGQAMAEFALTLVVLLLLVLGAVDLGRALFSYNMVANAAREGARCAAVPGCSDVEEAIKSHVAGIPRSHLQYSVSSSGDSVQVEVRYVFRPASALIARFMESGEAGPRLVLVSRAVMRKELP